MRQYELRQDPGIREALQRYNHRFESRAKALGFTNFGPAYHPRSNLYYPTRAIWRGYQAFKSFRYQRRPHFNRFYKRRRYYRRR